MKRNLFAVIILAAAVAVSGCSSSSSSPASSQQQDKSYNFSPSIWKSTDGGKTWEIKNVTKIKPPVSDLDVLGISIDPSNSNNLYAGLRSGGMIKSTDGGESWEFTNFISDKVYGLEVDPANSSVIYASGVWQGRGKMFKTEDGGANWKEIYTSAADGPLIISLTVDKKNSRTIYATTSINEVIKSTDAGVSWKNIYKAESPILKIGLDTSNDQLIYFLVKEGGVLRSRDGGATVESISENMALDGSIEDLKTDPSNVNWVYVCGSGGILRSKTAGDSWEKVPALHDPSIFPVNVLAVNPKNSMEIIYGAAQASYRSVDGGASWTTFQFNASKGMHVITYDPKNPNVVYIGFRK